MNLFDNICLKICLFPGKRIMNKAKANPNVAKNSVIPRSEATKESGF
jgi:hypothetical protein